MIHTWKKRLALCLSAALLVCLLCSCGGAKIEADSFTEQALSAHFTGESDDEYKELAGLTSDGAGEAYEQVLKDEADYFADYFDIDLNHISEKTYSRIVELYRTLLAKASYEVGEYTESGDGYLVSLTIAPMDIVQQVRNQDWASFQQQWIADYADLYEMEKDEFEEEWADRVLDLFDARINTVGYLDSETISIQIVKNDKSFAIESADVSRIDTLAIKY